MNPAGWITFLGILITAAVSLFSAITSSRATRRATERTAELARMNIQLESRDAQIASWRTDAETLRRQRDEESDKIVVLERQIEVFTRWASLVIRWYEATISVTKIPPLPKVPESLELNGNDQ